MNLDTLKGWFAKAVAAVRRWPVAQYVKPLWKGAVKAAARRELEALRAAVKADLATNEGRRLDELFDGAQQTIAAQIAALPLPAWAKAALQAADAALDAKVDALQADLKAALETRGPGAVDAAFDGAQAAVAAQIDAL